MKIEKEILIAFVIVIFIVLPMFIFNEIRLKREQRAIQEQVEQIIDDAIKKSEIKAEQLMDTSGLIDVTANYKYEEMKKLTIEIYGKDTVYTIMVDTPNKSGKRTKKRYLDIQAKGVN